MNREDLRMVAFAALRVFGAILAFALVCAGTLWFAVAVVGPRLAGV